MSDHAEGFPPIAREDARWLILGSMPSRASLAANEYYGHPRNQFWALMGRLCGAGPELNYAQRVEHLMKARIAVWDVLAACVRPGSLDSAIDPNSERVNDFAEFFARRCPKIEVVYFNGLKAATTYRRRVLPHLAGPAAELPLRTLPSTSPAMAAKNFDAKLADWSVIPCARP